MTRYIVQPQPADRLLAGDVTVPGDKSIGHRALLFGALCDGPVRIRGLGDGADNQRSARAMLAMGATVSRDGDDLIVRGPGLDGLRPPAAPIDCGNSGTTMRLLCGLLAGQPFASELFGDDSLSKRPMKRVIEPLARMGARLDGEKNAAGDVVPPLRIAGRPATGRLRGIEYALPVASAQVKSAVLLAGLWADGVTRVIEPAPTRDHTEVLLAHLGAPLTVGAGGVVTIDPAGWDRRLRGERLVVPGDPSSSAFLVAAALLAGATAVRLRGICVNSTRTGFLDALAAMGARVRVEAESAAGGERTADLVIERDAGAALVGTTIGGALAVRAIDELPILAVVAARARGETRVRDAAELRVKESDRVATTAAMLRGFGVAVDEHPDGFTVHGQGDRPLRAARVHAAGDHRIAMSAAIAGLVADGPTTIDDADNVATSYPGFVDTLRGLGATLAVE